MPRASTYRKNREYYVNKQRERRRKEKEKIAKALAELERLEKFQKGKEDLKTFESSEVKKAIRKQILEDSEDETQIGARPWK